MKVVSYLKSVPEKNTNLQKTELLVKFIAGVNAAGDTGIVHNGPGIIQSDVGMIQGWVYADLRTQHLQLRKQIIDTQQRSKKYVATADANLFLYNDSTNPHGYLRYSFNGIFPQTGIYCDTNPNPARWNQISKDKNIKLEKYKSTGDNILIMLQRNKGWSMKGLDVQQWALSTIRKIRKYSDRPILVRAHPGDKLAKHYLDPRNTIIKNIPGVHISPIGTPLAHDLQNTWAVINHNSSAIVGPLIKGYNCFTTDAESSQCAEVVNTNFSMIESPQQFDRQSWLERISMFHWKFSELEDGTCWRHMRDYVRQ
jgi:hypothetical protein